MAKEKKNREGRPYKLTPLIIQKLEEAASLDCSIDEMAFHADIAVGTYYAIIKRDPKILQRLEALRQKPFLLCRHIIQKKIRDGDADLALKYMERKRKAEFALRNEITGADGVNIINTEWVGAALNDPELAADISKLMGKIAKK